MSGVFYDELWGHENAKASGQSLFELSLKWFAFDLVGGGLRNSDLANTNLRMFRVFLGRVIRGDEYVLKSGRRRCRVRQFGRRRNGQARIAVSDYGPWVRNIFLAAHGECGQLDGCGVQSIPIHLVDVDTPKEPLVGGNRLV
jgi:hypothetical protein